MLRPTSTDPAPRHGFCVDSMLVIFPSLYKEDCTTAPRSGKLKINRIRSRNGSIDDTLRILTTASVLFVALLIYGVLAFVEQCVSQSWAKYRIFQKNPLSKTKPSPLLASAALPAAAASLLAVIGLRTLLWSAV